MSSETSQDSTNAAPTTDGTIVSRRTDADYLPELPSTERIASASVRDFVTRETALPTVVFTVVVLAWEFLLPMAGVAEYILPTPSAIGAAFLANRATILAELQITLGEFAIGFSATVATGYLLALSMAYSKTLEATFYPYVIVIRSIPVVTLLPIFIIWFGFGSTSIVAISFLISVFPMVVNSLAGFKSTDDQLVEMLRSFSANRREIYWHVYRYSSLPSVFAGLKICTILAFTGAIVGEFLLGQEGIGYLILAYNNSLSTPSMFAAILTVSITELAIFGAIHALEHVVVDWK
jgi:NitT/TauT family transport system permease protein